MEGYSNREEKEKASSVRHKVWEIFINYLDRCTMTGVPFIRSAENRYVKIAWSVLLIAAIALMNAHLYMLFTSFFQYSKYSEVRHTFSPLPFPAVTVCNVNPMRMSQRHQASVLLQKMIDELNPDKLVEEAAKTPIKEHTLDPQSSFSVDESEDFVGSLDDLLQSMFEDIFKEFGNHTVWNVSRLSGEPMEDAESSESSFYDVLELFKNKYSAEPKDIRKEMGHQLNDLVLACLIGGKRCQSRSFRHRYSAAFGNCYTLECPYATANKSGVSQGLTMTLHVESDEYIALLSEGKGAQLVIHERGTIPFPEDEGMALAVGTETLIGIRQVEVRRLGPPHGHCKPVGNFLNKFGVVPTRRTCIKACEQEMVVRDCGCYLVSHQGINELLNVSDDVPPCVVDGKMMACANRITTNPMTTLTECQCDNPCREKTFTKTISQRQWPSSKFLELLVMGICTDRPSECSWLRNKSITDLKNEFLRVTVYFEDLNYEEIIERKQYELTGFISDIGGTIGLWIGLSILGLCEVLHLILQLLFFLGTRLCPGETKLYTSLKTAGGNEAKTRNQ